MRYKKIDTKYLAFLLDKIITKLNEKGMRDYQIAAMLGTNAATLSSQKISGINLHAFTNHLRKLRLDFKIIATLEKLEIQIEILGDDAYEL